MRRGITWVAMKYAVVRRWLCSPAEKLMAMQKTIETLLGRKKKQGREKLRHLIAHDRQFNRKFNYANNYVKTAKYTLLSFLPVNLFEQFKRPANFYFLCLTVIQFIPSISSLQPYTTLLPLVFVLTVSAVKDAYDDIQRHRSDWKVNSRVSVVVRDGKTVEEKWRYVQVGDVIRMENENFVAADILLLSTSEPDGLCYIETAELDGETNLKAKQALSETAAMGEDLSELGAFNGEILLGPPCKLLPPVPQAFEGRLVWRGKNYPLDNEKMLLRGCVIRNTKWCYGVVVFAGQDTKLMMNSGKAHFKRTSLDGFINVLIIGIMVFLVCMCLICSFLCGMWEFVYSPSFVKYVPMDNGSSDPVGSIIFTAFLVFFSYIILLNTVVPTSLYVSVEIIRLFHSLLINWDEDMRYDKTGMSAMARTTTLNEELGQIQYIFSDKTGTLTQNIMTFKKCSIGGRKYGEAPDDITDDTVQPTELERINLKFCNKWAEERFCWYDGGLWRDTKCDPMVQTFWLLLSLCHTVMPEWKEDGSLEYQAQSPDEAALVSAARNFGFVFKRRNTNSITIEVLESSSEGEEQVYELLSILEFDNVRKRMSVLVRREGVTTLYCKGADMVILPRLSRSRINEDLVAVTQSHLDAFASEGLRTLCLAYKTVNERYCSDWLRRHYELRAALENRKEGLAELYEEIEQNMTLVGATAIEDKLQDGVTETIDNLSKAKIKIWVLTGDKQETAVNIGYSSCLLTQDMQNIFVINSQEFDVVERQLQEASEELRRYKTALQPKRVPAAPEEGHPRLTKRASFVGSIFYDVDQDTGDGNALVIDGHSLVHALDDRLETLFVKVARQCRSVICCRVTPSQKAAVVDLVNRNEHAVTLAIGDGANDVPMIKCAHIGVGISGQEGAQAVLASDFSIAQFRFIQRLLLVHGRWSYLRMAKFMKYFFYKNFAFTLVQFWFAFFSGYSAQTLYDSFFICTYNMVFTALPVLAVGILDQDVDDKCSVEYPLLYTPGPTNRLFNMRAFGISLLHGVVTSMALFFVTLLTMGANVDRDGRNVADIDSFGFTIISALVFSVSGQIALDTAHWTYLNLVALFLSLAGFFVFSIFYYEIFPYTRWILQAGYGSAFVAMNTSTYWLTVFLCGAVTLLPVVAVRYLCVTIQPTLSYKVRAKRRVGQQGTADHKSPLDRSISYEHAVSNRSVPGSAVLSPFTSPIPRPPFMAHRHQPSAFSLPAAASPSVWRRRGSRVRTESIRSGYAFSHEYGFGERIVTGVLRMRSELQ